MRSVALGPVDRCAVVRPWDASDAPEMGAAVAASIEHLRPFLPWVAHEPLSLDDRRRLIEGWREQEAAGGDRVFGIWIDGRVAGMCGLHRRIGPTGLEIGYWVHIDFVRQGVATAVARSLTDLAFEEPAIDRVEIRHDPANVPSGRVPAALGYELVGRVPHVAVAPAETGTDLVWRVRRERWVVGDRADGE